MAQTQKEIGGKMINLFKQYYFIKCIVTGSLKSNEGQKLIYFTIKCKSSKLEDGIKKHCSENNYDLTEIIFVTEL